MRAHWGAQRQQHGADRGNGRDPVNTPRRNHVPAFPVTHPLLIGEAAPGGSQGTSAGHVGVSRRYSFSALPPKYMTCLVIFLTASAVKVSVALVKVVALAWVATHSSAVPSVVNVIEVPIVK